MTCTVCGRASRGYGFQPRRRDPFDSLPARQFACSMRCLDILSRKSGTVFSLNHYEDQAIEAASGAAGEYLETLGRTDLALLTGDEWTALLQTVFVTACATIQRLTDDGAVPF